MTDHEVLEEIAFVLRHVTHQQVIDCLCHARDALQRHVCAETLEVAS